METLKAKGLRPRKGAEVLLSCLPQCVKWEAISEVPGFPDNEAQWPLSWERHWHNEGEASWATRSAPGPKVPHSHHYCGQCSTWYLWVRISLSTNRAVNVKMGIVHINTHLKVILPCHHEKSGVWDNRQPGLNWPSQTAEGRQPSAAAVGGERLPVTENADRGRHRCDGEVLQGSRIRVRHAAVSKSTHAASHAE